MAIGLALLCGFDFPKNFDHPYISQSITQADVGKVVDRVRPIEPIDTIILLLNVGSASKFVTWADALAALASR